MKKILITGIMIFMPWASSMAEELDHLLMSKITLEQDKPKVTLADNAFSQVVMQNIINVMSKKIDNDRPITLFNEATTWAPLSGNAQGTHLLRFSISANQFAKGKLKINGAQRSSLYLNKSMVVGENEFALELLNQDYRALLVVSGVVQWDDFSVEWLNEATVDTQSNAKIGVSTHSNNQPAVTFGDDSSNKRASMKHYFDSQTVGTLNISPDAELLIWSKTQYSDLTGDKASNIVEIIDLDSQEVVYRWQAMAPVLMTWQAQSEALVFMHDNQLYHLARKGWKLTQLAWDLKGIKNITWLNNSELLLSWHKEEEKPHAFTKRYRALEDRWDYWRGDLQIHILDIKSGMFKQITHGNLSSSISDVDVKNRKALITRRPVDYKEPPHSITQLFELDLSSGNEKLIGEYRTFNSAQFHKNGIVIVAGPDFKNGNGNNVSTADIANNYDGQLYLLDSQGNAIPLSKTFKPSISKVEVLVNGDLVISTSDEDKRQLYLFDLSREKFTKLDTKVEVVSGFTVSKQAKATIVYKGSSATTPQSVHARTTASSKGKTLFDSVEQEYAKVDFIDLKDWDYETKAGQLIDGRVYYPPNFDKTKKYPAIIYYYAGTTTVSRSFTGRWPFSLWASKGYVVYILQPSGAIGYGQDFSARHVNAWGINAADEIIESTKAFVKAHPYVDEKRLGNMGASYGGFMTMYLATKTNIFAASISHAGISNLTSYWGHGWWGYLYSGIATKASFPWNKTDFYTQQSPIFAADKVQTPMLLIHGDADTNVPVGESHQMYTALMLLGQDVELIEFQGDDHHINTRERRLRWWKTILSYYDMKLKNEPQWWESLYPEK
jgi:dipeptidyl aminopeptidase/acylaminoacyl peptidase